MGVNKIIGNRFIERKRPNGVVRLDFLHKPFLLESLQEAGMTSENGLTFRKIIELANFSEDDKKNLPMRIRRLSERGWINRKRLNKQQRNFLGFDRGGDAYIYFLGSRSTDYLTRYGSFTNPKAPLMNPPILQENQYQNKGELSQSEYPNEFDMIIKDDK